MIRALRGRTALLSELVYFFWSRKWWWLTPLVLLLVLIAALLVFAQGSALAQRMRADAGVKTKTVRNVDPKAFSKKALVVREDEGSKRVGAR